MSLVGKAIEEFYNNYELHFELISQLDLNN
jgi:hypothetical protein